MLNEKIILLSGSNLRGAYNMGKSCIRFKKLDDIPYKLIGELMKKMSVKRWITTYETNFKK